VNVTLLDQASVTSHDLVGEPTERRAFGHASVNGVDMVDVGSLELGALRMEGIRLAVMDLLM